MEETTEAVASDSPEPEGVKEEEIKLSDSDELLMRKLRFRVSESESLLKKRLNQWEKQKKFFDGKHWEIAGVKLPRYKADTVVNKFFGAVRSLVAFETDTKPESEVDVSVNSTDPNAELLHERAKKVDAALDFNWDFLQLPATLTEIYYDRYIYDDGFGMYFWNEEIDNVDFEQIRPHELLVSPGASCVEDAEYLVVKKWRNRKWFDSHYPEKVDDIKFSGVKKDNADSELEESKYANMARIYTYMENELWVISTDDKVLDKFANPYWEWRTEDEQQTEMEEDIGVVPPDWTPITNHLIKPEIPIVHFKGYHLAGEFYSQSLAKQVMDINFNINHRKCQIEDNANAVGSGQHIIDPSVPKTIRDLITSQPGLKIAINPTLYRKESGVPLPEFVFADLQHSEQKFDDLMGHHEVSRGASPTKRQTKAEVMMLRETDITPVRLLMRNSEVAMTKLLNGWTQLMKLFYDRRHYVGKLGSGGKEGAQSYLIREEIPNNLSIIIKVGSTIPVSQETRRLEWERWTTAGMMDLKTFYEKMGEPNPEKLANRAMNSRMGILSDEPPQAPQPQGV